MGLNAVLWFWVLFGAMGGMAAGPEYSATRTPHISESTFHEIRSLIEAPINVRTDLASSEFRYQMLVQEQTLRDLLMIYDPANQEKLEITYPRFVQSSESDRMGDLGTGFHVVKKLRWQLADGTAKQVEVNELWQLNPLDGGLFLPDDIRIKTLAFGGPRDVAGSERLFLFDQIRVGWGQYDVPVVGRQSKYYYNRSQGRSYTKRMRSAVSAPYRCAGCHYPESDLSEDFRTPGMAVTSESIVQPDYFARRLEDTQGYRQYFEFTEREGRPRDLIEKMKHAFSPEMAAYTFEVPGLYQAIERVLAKRAFSWIGQDLAMAESETPFSAYFVSRRGLFQLRNRDTKQYEILRDDVESLVEGTYLWWEPHSFVPRPVPNFY